MNTLEYSTAIADKKRRAFATFPPTHKRSPVNGEVFDSKDAAILRLKDWSCTQGFAAVLGHGEHKDREIQWVLCSRHGKKTRNTRKHTEETRKRSHNLVNHNECPYKVKIRYYKRDSEWRINIIDGTHNHEMLNDPFQFKEHYCRDPDRDDAKEEARDLRAAALPFCDARRVMRTKGLRLSSQEYYNFRDRGRKRTAQEELLYALRTLETKGFKVRIKEKYVVDNNIRQKQEVEFFFFTSPKQIRLARQFASHFVVITDATFNTNENGLPLSVIVCVTNTLRSIPIAYCLIESESTDAFHFMNDCMKDLFFYDDCRGPAVILGDFAAGLTAAMVKKKMNLLTLSEDHLGTIAEAGMQVAWRLSHQLDDLGSDCFLQLCNWHAAEAIKKRLTREGYPLHMRKPLADLVWKWIQSKTLDDLERNRGVLLDQLHQKEQNYLTNFYQRQEYQFVMAYTKQLPNLGCNSTQRGESVHPLVKSVTNRHTPIGQSVEKIAEEVDETIYTYEYELERQKRNNPRSIDASRSFFKGILGHVTHQAIELVHAELIAAKNWCFDVEDKVSPAPQGNTCQEACHLPKRYGLPCKCWLYRCVVEQIPIPLSLWHPRWFVTAPEVVVDWQMTFDSIVIPAGPITLAATNDTRSQFSSHSNDDDDRGTAPIPTQSRYDRRGMDLLEAGAFSAYEFHKKILEAHRAEEYTRELTKAISKVNRAYGQKYDEKAVLSQSFTVAKKDDEGLQYKKNGSRRRALTGREAADVEDQALRRQIRKNQLEQERVEKFAQRSQMEKNSQIASAFSQAIWPEEDRESSSLTSSLTQQRKSRGLVRDGVTDFDNIFSAHDSDSDIQILGTQPAQNPSRVSSEDRINTPSPLISEPSLNDFANIDDFDDFPPLSPSPPSPSLPPPLLEWPDRRSQQQRLLVSEDPNPTPSMTTRAKRGVASKTNRQARWESQQQRDAKAKTEEAAARKKAKSMKPREEDVSQLADHLLSSSL